MITNGARCKCAFKSRFPMTKAEFNNEELLSRVIVGTNILQTIKRRKATWVSHMLPRNCLLKHVIEEKRERGYK
jgi:hypothetical protein